MDDLLKLAGDAGYYISLAENAIEEDAHDAARDALDRAAESLEDLRGRWPEMSDREREIVGPAAKVVRARFDAAAARVPARRALSEGTAEVDPEQESEPDAPPAA
jgi:flavin-binding protein dodecin